MKETPILDTIQLPAQLRALPEAKLQSLADELRAETIRIVSNTGGHLGAGLGVIELTVALHYVFDTPRDKIIWDVGHQAYPHKILTGRRGQMHTLRKPDGLSGFLRRSESEYDTFGAGHSSTSISAALGMAVARDFKQESNEVIAVIGDGAMSAGMAYEAMNNAGAAKSKLIVILNDNDMSIAPAVGAMNSYLSRMIASKTFHAVRNAAKKALKHMPEFMERITKRAEKNAKDMALGTSNFFEDMGFYYVGPLDGHNIEQLVSILRNIKEDPTPRPYLIHVVTEKGHGFDSPEASSEKFHAVKKFDVVTKVQEKTAPSAAPSYTSVFAGALIEAAKRDTKIIAITAAMPSGTGLDKFAQAFPERCFDVGIAEQHAVTFAAGLAAEGFAPFVTIYSTFLQRAFDQVVHDVAIQNLPVRFAIDRAGLVGADGPTHAGSFDIAYLSMLPNFVVMAAADESELVHMVHTAAHYAAGPIAFRYPRGDASGKALPAEPELLEIGKGRVIKRGSKIALISLGTRLDECMKAAEQLESKGLSTTVVDARFAKPIDKALIKELVESHIVCITLEEGCAGGFGAQVTKFLQDEHPESLQHCVLHCLTLPDNFQEHGNPQAMYEAAGLNASGITAAALRALKAQQAANASNS